MHPPQGKDFLRIIAPLEWIGSNAAMATKTPVVGVIGSAHLAEGKFPAQRVAERILRAAANTAGALPLIFAGTPDITEIGALLDTVDGILLTGARANVHPSYFGEEEGPAYEPYDRGRDAVALPLIEAAVTRGVPLFGICRGFQEINVAFGGTLHPEIRELPGRLNHRALRRENGEIIPDPTVLYAERHDVRLTPGGVFAKLLGTECIRVNSLHGQGILKPGDRVVIEGMAEDETIEAIRIDAAPSFALGVQWHAEHIPDKDLAGASSVNRTLFEAFGAAVKKYQKTR
jgi:putative glutamine amidotransferase